MIRHSLPSRRSARSRCCNVRSPRRPLPSRRSVRSRCPDVPTFFSFQLSPPFCSFHLFPAGGRGGRGRGEGQGQGAGTVGRLDDEDGTVTVFTGHFLSGGQSRASSSSSSSSSGVVDVCAAGISIICITEACGSHGVGSGNMAHRERRIRRLSPAS